MECGELVFLLSVLFARVVIVSHFHTGLMISSNIRWYYYTDKFTSIRTFCSVLPLVFGVVVLCFPAFSPFVDVLINDTFFVEDTS